MFARQPRPNATLIDILNCYPVFDVLGDFFLVGDIIHLTRTCKGLSTLYQELLVSKWNIDRFMSPFFTDTKGFRSQMAEHDALISGQFALDSFAKQTSVDSRISLYMGLGPGILILDSFLRNK